MNNENDGKWSILVWITLGTALIWSAGWLIGEAFWAYAGGLM